MLPSETGKYDFARIEVLSYLSDQELAMFQEQCAACVFSARMLSLTARNKTSLFILLCMVVFIF